MKTAAHYTASSWTDPGTDLQDAELIGAVQRQDFYDIYELRKEIEHNDFDYETFTLANSTCDC